MSDSKLEKQLILVMDLIIKHKKPITAIILLITLCIASLVINYYWSATNFIAIRYVPSKIMVLLFLYILCHLLKRAISKKQIWYDWLYYIGLVAVVIPVFIASPTNNSILLPSVQIGVLFLVIPLLIEGYFITKERKQ